MGPVITPESRERIFKVIDRAVSEGARAVVDGRNPEVPRYPRGNFVGPTILEGLEFSSEITGTEIFGPVLSMHHVNNIEEAIALVNTGRYGNQACIFTTSVGMVVVTKGWPRRTSRSPGASQHSQTRSMR